MKNPLTLKKPTLSFPASRVLLALSCLSLAAIAQQPPATPSATPPAPANHQLLLDVLVTSKSGKPVPGLQPQDFTVLDDSQPAKVLLFHQHNIADTPANQVDASTNVIIVLDQVNTPFSKVTFGRQGIQAFLKQNNGNLNHPVTLAFFTDSGLQIQTQPSIDGNALSAAIDKQEQSFRVIEEGTQYGGADRLRLSIDALENMIATEKTRPGRKLILWVSPGWPYLSGPQNTLTAGQQQQTLASAIQLSTGLRQARMTLYSIDPLGLAGVGTARARYYENFLKPLTDPNKAYLADLSLQVLAAQSGGGVLFGNDLIQSYLNRAIDDLSAFYTLTIEPAPSAQPGQFHSLEIKLSNPRLKAITRNGYYAQP